MNGLDEIGHRDPLRNPIKNAAWATALSCRLSVPILSDEHPDPAALIQIRRHRRIAVLLVAATDTRLPGAVGPKFTDQTQIYRSISGRMLPAKPLHPNSPRSARIDGVRRIYVGLVPSAVSAIVSAFGTPILSGVAGPVTKFVLGGLGEDDK
jgi:hypothetical protein